MGSHNGGTAEGQRAMIESLGITEQAMGMPIRASMDVVKIGTVSSGDVWMDRHAFESDGVLALNRIKLHTGTCKGHNPKQPRVGCSNVLVDVDYVAIGIGNDEVGRPARAFICFRLKLHPLRS